MQLTTIPPVSTPKFYLDVAFKRARKKAGNISGRDLVLKRRQQELMRLQIIQQTLRTKLEEIIKSFPDLSQLPEFYQELIKCTLDYGLIRKSLGGVQWAEDRIAKLFKEYQSKIARCRDTRQMTSHRNAYYGRIASVLKQIKVELEYLEHTRRILKGYPIIKDLPTICIFGFPNVGKTTLLSILTHSTPEINTYPFTTKSINIGNLEIEGQKIQFLDTPGALNRFEQMNAIEKQAYLALQYLADAIIVVIDPTEPYPLKKQLKLLKKAISFQKPVVVYISKTDIVSDIEHLKHLNPVLSPKELIEKIKQLF